MKEQFSFIDFMMVNEERIPNSTTLDFGINIGLHLLIFEKI